MQYSLLLLAFPFILSKRAMNKLKQLKVYFFSWDVAALDILVRKAIYLIGKKTGKQTCICEPDNLP